MEPAVAVAVDGKFPKNGGKDRKRRSVSGTGRGRRFSKRAREPVAAEVMMELLLSRNHYYMEPALPVFSIS